MEQQRISILLQRPRKSIICWWTELETKLYSAFLKLRENGQLYVKYDSEHIPVEFSITCITILVPISDF